jgi:hypothetical protein
MSGAEVSPGTRRPYAFYVNGEPTDLNTNCVTYIYHSAVDFTKDIYSGLFGPLLVCKRGTLSSDGKQVRILSS